MKENTKLSVLWRRVLVPVLISVLIYFSTVYLIEVFQNQGTEKFIYSLVLIASLFIGVAHIVLYIQRKAIENETSQYYKKRKRILERWRNIVNYITPFILVAMLYHFWVKGWVLAVVIIAVLLFDRINELRRMNK